MIGHNTNIYIHVLSTKMMIFVHKQDDYQRVTHPTKVTLSKAKRVLANMDSELNSSHGGSTTVGPIASEVEYTLPTFGNSPIA